MSNDVFTFAGHPVRRIGFGAMQLPGPGVFGPPQDHDAAIAVLRRAIELGVDHIDTAQFYGPDVSNALIREALHPYPTDLVLVTKLGAVRDADGAWLPAQRPTQLREQLETNLRELDVDQLPVANLRVMPADEIPADEVVPLEDQLGAMRQLVSDGLIESFGVSNVTTDQARAGLDAGAVCVQNAYSLLQRDDQPTLELCTERGVAYVPFFPLGSAFPGLPKVTDDAVVRQVAAERGATPAQVGLAWLLAQSDNVLLIPGTSSTEHLQENLAAADVQLTDDELARLDAERPSA